MKFASEAHKHQYYCGIQDLNELIIMYGAQQVLDDLKLLDLTNYEELVRIVMKADGIKKQTAILLKDPYFAHQD